MTVSLRPVEAADLPFLARLYDDAGPFVAPTGVSLATLRRRWARDRHRSERDGKLIVVDDGVSVGVVSWIAHQYFTTEKSRCWNIGIVLAREHRGCGLGSAAQRALADHLFVTTSAHRVEAGTDITNVAERRALTSAGFTEEGILRAAQFRDGRWHDMALYSRTRADQQA
jgi:RimJ/RimL family protein N-acetyltransferase